MHNAYYIDLKKTANTCLYAERKAYFTQNINANINKPKTLWRNLKKTVLPDSKKCVEIPQHLLDPELLNTHFLNVPGHNFVSLADLTYFEWHRAVFAEFKLTPVLEQEIGKIILNIKSNAQGVDRISRDMVLLTLPHTLGIITNIINQSIATCTFPSQWKTALVRPIPKNNNPNEPKDLRPISLLPYLSKILERVVFNQLSRYCESQGILPKLQSGFRKGRSTTTALLDVVDNILSFQDSGMATILVLLDYSRAFDSISIPLLLSKMSYYGFHASAIKWFDSYLSNRSQQVEIVALDGTVHASQLKPVNRGVPQGSILGPLLFIIYTSDLIKCIHNSHYHLYADDLQLYLPIDKKQFNNSIADLNEDLDRIASWSVKNCLVANPDKSKYMILGSDKQIADIVDRNPVISMSGVSIGRVDEARNLGILMDGRLRFENYVAEIVRNCFYRIKILYKIRDFIGVNLRISLCEALVMSKLNYCITVYGPCLLARSQALIQRVQNACARYCFTIPPRFHVTPFLNRSNILRMSDRQDLYLATLMFGVVRNKIPEYLYKKLNWRSSRKNDYARTCVPPLLLPPRRTEAFTRAFRYRASKIWNNIPPPLRNSSTSINSFRCKYKLYLLQNANSKACV